MEKIAILIDAENISYKNAKQIIDTMSEKGNVLIKEVVADWTKIVKAKAVQTAKIDYREAQISGWRQEAKTYSMTAIQQFSYVAGKNSSDLALAIRAMKLLYEKPFITSFCLVSNDSDFTRLAQELREHDKLVIGMGERKAVKEFVNAFSEFVYLGETIEEEVATPEKKTPKKPKSSKPSVAVAECPIEEDKLRALCTLVGELVESNDNGHAYYSAIADNMKKQFADFIPQNYGCKNSSQLIDKVLPFMSKFEKKSEKMPNNPNGTILYLMKK